MAETLSIIIPTLNEAARLPALLQALQAQTRPPREIIVADAGSKDATISIAREAGVTVVPGGMPARGRNAGARVASGSLLLFLDADVLPAPDFIQKMLREFRGRRLDGATTLVTPLEQSASNSLACEITNLYLQIIQPVSPHAPGFCILVRKTLHQKIGGFDETVVMAEDHRYAHQMVHAGRFGVLTRVKIPISMRRLDKEGFVRLAFKYLYCEFYALARRPIHTIPFRYEFGSFTEKSGPALADIATLRSRLGRLKDPLAYLSEHSRAAFESLGSLELSAEAFEQTLGALRPAELSVLQRYLGRRLTLLRSLPGQIEPFFEAARKRLPEILWLDSILPDPLKPFFRRNEDRS